MGERQLIPASSNFEKSKTVKRIGGQDTLSQKCIHATVEIRPGTLFYVLFLGQLGP